MTKLAALMAGSVFPDELPGHFTTSEMKNWLNAVTYRPPRLDDASGKKHPKEISKNWPAPTKLIRFSIAKRNGGRRAMYVACPETQFLVCTLINRYWTQIDRRFRKSGLSLAALEYDQQRDQVDWRDYDGQVVEERHERAAGYSSTLRADISSYYPSIYTHAIAWSILGKAKSKKTKNRSHWGNMLDAAIRHSQERKSNGIPAGLLSSHIIAEILGCAVDQDLEKIHTVVGSRKVVDFLLHFSDDLAATKLRSTLQSVLASYNLYINEAKTKIETGPHFLVPEWVDDLESISTEDVPNAGRRQELAQTFASRIYRLKHANKAAPIYKKALPKMSIFLEKNPNESVARTCENLCLNAIQSEPEASAEVLSLLDRIDKSGWPADNDQVARVVNDTLEQVVPLHHSGEASHLFWIARKRGYAVRLAVWNLLVKNPNHLLAVQAFDLDARNLFHAVGARHRSRLAAAVRGLDDEGSWLFDYEAQRRNWTNVPVVSLPPMLDLMRINNVSFLSTPV